MVLRDTTPACGDWRRRATFRGASAVGHGVAMPRGRQAKRYTWRRTAERVREVHEEVVAPGEVFRSRRPELAASL